MTLPMAVFAVLALGATAPAHGTGSTTEWPTTAVAYNLGGDLNGQYADGSGISYTGADRIVVDIDGAFTAGNPLLSAPDGASKIAGEVCIGQPADLTPFPTLCANASAPIQPSWPGSNPMYFSTLNGASRPSNSPVNSCTDAGNFCHDVHGTATAGTIVGQPGSRFEGFDKVYTTGAAVGAKVFQIKIGGGNSQTGRIGWPHESVVDGLDWVNYVLTTWPAYAGKIAAVNLSVSGGALPDGSTCGADGARIDAAAARLKQKGIAVVMAAGNDGINGVGTWNCGPNIIRVGSTDIAIPRTLASTSNRSEAIQLYAPVGDGDYQNHNAPLVPWKSNGTFYATGTSFAAPQVAGAFAVLREKFGNAPTVDQLTSLLQRTGTTLTGNDAPANAVDLNITAALHNTP